MIEQAAPDLGSVDGLLILYFQRRNESKIAYFLLVTIWDTPDSIKKFVGDKPAFAKYYPEDDNFLLEKEKHTTMYEVFYEK